MVDMQHGLSQAVPQGKAHPLTKAAETTPLAMKASFHLQLSGLHQLISEKSLSPGRGLVRGYIFMG